MATATTFKCAEIFARDRYKVGDLTQDNEVHTTYELGRGWNGIILRVFPKNHSPAFIVKIYKSNNPSVITTDILGLNVLAQLPHANKDFFVTSVLGQETSTVVKLSDVRGYTISEMSVENGFTPEKRTLLLSKYRKALLSIQSDFERDPQYQIISQSLDGMDSDYPTLNMTVSGPFGTVHLIIKPENVIVDINDDVVVVDSF